MKGRVKVVHFSPGLILGYVDGFEPLNEADILLQLDHFLFQTLLVGFL